MTPSSGLPLAAAFAAALAAAGPALAAAGDDVECGRAGVRATVALAYDSDTLGKISATYVTLAFDRPLAMPDGELGKRLASVLPPYRVAPAKGERGTVRVALTTTEPGIPPKDVFTIRFDCRAGARVRSTDVGCRTDGVTDGAGLPMDAALARQVGCTVVRMEPAAPAG